MGTGRKNSCSCCRGILALMVAGATSTTSAGGRSVRSASLSFSADASRSLSFSGPPIRILAYGDSITAGWHDMGKELTPYAPTLEMELRAALKNRDVIVRHRGWVHHPSIRTYAPPGGCVSLPREQPPPSPGRMFACTPLLPTYTPSPSQQVVWLDGTEHGRGQSRRGYWPPGHPQ